MGWTCWLALDGNEPASAAAIFVSEGVGYLGFAATLPEHRGKGAQTERRDDRPASSYRNIVRRGFEEFFVTANWLGRG